MTKTYKCELCGRESWYEYKLPTLSPEAYKKIEEWVKENNELKTLIMSRDLNERIEVRVVKMNNLLTFLKKMVKE